MHKWIEIARVITFEIVNYSQRQQKRENEKVNEIIFRSVHVDISMFYNVFNALSIGLILFAASIGALIFMTSSKRAVVVVVYK